MKYNELFIKISYLKKINNIKQTEIGQAIGLDKAAINKRAKNNSKFSETEVKEIEKTFNVNLSDVNITENTLKRQFDEDIKMKHKGINERIYEIKEKNNLTDIQMAGLMNISESELKNLITGKIFPDINLLDNLKQNFKVSIDWLLYGG